MPLSILIVEDDFTSRRIMRHILEAYGACDIAVDGREAVEAVRIRLKEVGRPYDLVVLDIMMPRMDGQRALKAIRGVERDGGLLPGRGARILITSALDDSENVLEAFRSDCDGYLVKPYDRQKIVAELEAQGLV